jgi:hypothetical protein
MIKLWSIGRLWNGRTTIGYNGLGIGEGRAFEKCQLNLRTKADRSTNVELLPSALLLPIPC